MITLNALQKYFYYSTVQDNQLELGESFTSPNAILTGTEACIGKSSCTVTFADGINDDRYIFAKARCQNTEAIFDLGGETVEVKKTYIVLVVAGLDFIIIIIFAIGIAL